MGRVLVFAAVAFITFGFGASVRGDIVSIETRAWGQATAQAITGGPIVTQTYDSPGAGSVSLTDKFGVSFAQSTAAWNEISMAGNDRFHPPGNRAMAQAITVFDSVDGAVPVTASGFWTAGVAFQWRVEDLTAGTTMFSRSVNSPGVTTNVPFLFTNSFTAEHAHVYKLTVFGDLIGLDFDSRARLHIDAPTIVPIPQAGLAGLALIGAVVLTKVRQRQLA